MKQITLIFLFFIFISQLKAEKGNDPDFFSKEYIRNSMTRALDWQFSHPKHETWDWTNGAFYAGVFSAYQTLQKTYILDSLLAMGERNHWNPGPRIHHADDWVICQTYIDLYQIKKEQKMIQPFIDSLRLFGQKTNIESANHGITWWWCDALFMGPPALVKLGMAIQDSQYLELSDSMYFQTYRLLFNHNEHLFARDAGYLWKNLPTDRKEKNGNPVFWGRGNGWVMGGLVKIISELPQSYPSRKFYIELFKEMSHRLIQLQVTDGFWRTSLLDPNSYPGGEASGTGFFCYALAWGINNGILDRSTYLPVVKKAWTGLCKCQLLDGRIGWTQPIGADPQKNFSYESWEVYGTGAFLSAGSEVIKLKF